MDDTVNDAVLTGGAILCCIILISAMKLRQSRGNKKRKIWARNWLRRRPQGKTVFHMLNEELKYEDPNSYKNFLWMNNEQLEELLNLIGAVIAKKDTGMRDSIPARSKLEITLRFLATGESFRSLIYYTRVHESTISRFNPLVCEAICTALRDQYLKTPKDEETWSAVAESFNTMWQFPHCLGAIDGRHIEFRAPISAGSYYFNYKDSHSIVLLALVDAKYKFLYVNIGVNGRVSDSGVYNQSTLKQALEKKMLHIPPSDVLPGQRHKTPFVIIGDEAFPLGENLLKPFPQRELTPDKRIFNYRLSRARRIVENAFGILANRFRVLLNPINLSVNKVELVT